MATDTDDQALIEAEEKQPRFSKKKKIIAAAVAGVLVLAGTGGALMLGGGDDAGKEADADDDEAQGESGNGETNFVEVAPMVINLRSSDGQARFLKLRFLLAAASPGDMAVIQAKLPQILDRYQPFLRELRPDDLAGSAAVYRLKEEMLLRARDVLGAGVVNDVLIQDMIQQ